MQLEARLRAALGALGVGDADRIGVACSGGADSTALVHLIAGLSRTHDASAMAVLHVDHGLRGSAADDAEFVEDTAVRLGLGYAGRRVEVTRRSGSIEAGAREARYGALEAMADEMDLSFVLTAHTLDDQAETVLLRSLRGGSVAAIAPVRGMFVRPLLGMRRQELRAWLEAHRIGWRTDDSNEDTAFERNWLRSEIMPLLERRRPGVAAALGRVAVRARADGDALDTLAARALERAHIDDVGLEVGIDGLPRALRTRVITGAFRRLGAEIHGGELDAISAPAMPASGSRHVACGDLDAWCSDERLVLASRPAPTLGAVAVASHGVVELHDWCIRVRVGRAGAEPWRWRCPVDPAASSIEIRSRAAGDRVLTSGGTRKVQDVLVDAKILRPLRDFVPVLAVNGVARGVVGLTSAPGSTGGASDLVVDVEPSSPTWSRETVWNRPGAEESLWTHT